MRFACLLSVGLLLVAIHGVSAGYMQRTYQDNLCNGNIVHQEFWMTGLRACEKDYYDNVPWFYWDCNATHEYAHYCQDSVCSNCTLVHTARIDVCSGENYYPKTDVCFPQGTLPTHDDLFKNGKNLQIEWFSNAACDKRDMLGYWRMDECFRISPTMSQMYKTPVPGSETLYDIMTCKSTDCSTNCSTVRSRFGTHGECRLDSNGHWAVASLYVPTPPPPPTPSPPSPDSPPSGSSSAGVAVTSVFITLAVVGVVAAGAFFYYKKRMQDPSNDPSYSFSPLMGNK